MRTGKAGQRRHCRGFTYLWLMIVVLVIAIGLAAIGEQWSMSADQQRREELAWVGEQYVRAIESYHESAPDGVKRYPPSLEELLHDSRFAGMKRHLRRVYVNPVNLEIGWEWIRAPDGGLAGVVSKGTQSTREMSFVYAPLAATR